MAKSLIKLVEEMKALLNTAEQESVSFETKAINAAGKRVRKAMQDIRVAAKEARSLVTDIKNERKGSKPKPKAKKKVKK